MTTVNLGVKQVEIKTDLPNLLGVVSPNRTFAVCFDKIQVISLGCDLETAGACLARRQRQLTRLARTEALPDPSRAALHRRSCSVRRWGGGRPAGLPRRDLTSRGLLSRLCSICPSPACR